MRNRTRIALVTGLSLALALASALAAHAAVLASYYHT